MNKLTRFALSASTDADHLANWKDSYARMERRADELKAQRDELLAACEAAEALIRNGGCVPVKGVTWQKLFAAIATCAPRHEESIHPMDRKVD